MSNIITRPPWTRQPQVKARGDGRSGLLLNFTELKPAPNESAFAPQSWTVGASSVIRPATGGIGLYCGSSVAGNSFGSAAAFDAFAPASTAAWMAVAITGAAYASQGSGVNIIASYGSANAASGWYFYLDSSSNLGARCGNTDITTTLTLAAGRVYHIVACRSAAGACELWANGVRVGSGSGATAAVAGNAYQLYAGGDSGTARAYQGTVHSLALGTRDIVGSGAARLSQNLYGFFAPIARRIGEPVSATTGRTGDLAVTLDAATVSAAGTVALAGALSATLASATLSSAGTVALTGALASTLDDATLAATGTTGTTAALDVTLDAATVSAAGTLAIAASSAVTLDAATLASASALAIAGAASITLDAATLSADGVGVQVNAGTLAVTLDSATVSAAGHVDIAAALGVTLADASVASAGTLAIAGAAAITLADVSLSAYGTSGAQIVADVAVTLDDLVIAARGRLQVLGAATIGHGPAASSRPRVTSGRRPANVSSRKR